MEKGGKVRGHLVDGWKMRMKRPEELGMWLERRDGETRCDKFFLIVFNHFIFLQIPV